MISVLFAIKEVTLSLAYCYANKEGTFALTDCYFFKSMSETLREPQLLMIFEVTLILSTRLSQARIVPPLTITQEILIIVLFRKTTLKV